MGYLTHDVPIVVECYSEGKAYWHKIGEEKQHKSVLYTDNYGQYYFKYKNMFIYSRQYFSAGMIGGYGGKNVYELWVKDGKLIVNVETGQKVSIDPRIHCMQFNH